MLHREQWHLYYGDYQAEKVEILRIMTKKIELGRGTQHESKDDRKAVKIKWPMPWDMLVEYEDEG